jgi:Flp pilus assembly protein TadG
MAAPSSATSRTWFLRAMRGLAHDEAGVAAIEFAIFATVFLMILAATVDIGLLLFTQSELDAAVSAGAEYAAPSDKLVNSTSGGALATSIANIVTNANGANSANATIVVNDGPTVTVTNGTSSSSGTAGNADSCYCPTGTPGNWSWGSAVTCGSACGGGGVAGQFVTISASTTVSPLFPAFGFVQNGGTINSYALVETQ